MERCKLDSAREGVMAGRARPGKATGVREGLEVRISGINADSRKRKGRGYLS